MALSEPVNATTAFSPDQQPHLYICDRSGTCVRASPLTCLQGQKLTCPRGEVWRAHGLPAILGTRLQGSLEHVLESGEIVRVLIPTGGGDGLARAGYACQLMPVELEDQGLGVAVSIRQLPTTPPEPGNPLRREMLDRLPTPTVVIRISDWKCHYANAAAAALFGRSPDCLLNQSLASHFQHQGDAERIQEELVLNRQVEEFESVVVDDAGNSRHVRICGGSAFSRGSQAALLTITPGRASRPPHVAERDALTGLPNRNALADRLDSAIRRANAGNTMVAVLFVDLNGFKAVNDDYGHRTGDELLAVIAMRLGGCVRRHETLGRYGGDEFVVIIEDLVESGDALRVQRDILRVIDQKVEIGGRLLWVGAAVGIAYYPFDATCADDLLHAADQAMYRDKRRPRIVTGGEPKAV